MTYADLETPAARPRGTSAPPPVGPSPTVGPSLAREHAAGAHPIFMERWSPRAFATDPVKEEDLLALFEAARWAPSSNNEQPWYLVYATRPEDRDRFASALYEGNRVWAARAPVLMFLVARTRARRDGADNPAALFDAGAAWMSLALQARMLGLYTHAMGGIDRQKAHEILGISGEGDQVIIGIALGRRAEPNVLPPFLAQRERPSQRRPLSEVAFEGSAAGPRGSDG